MLFTLDFSKAFDKVDHSIVLTKFKKLGITGKIYNWIESFLKDWQQTVVLNGVKSKPQEVTPGVPQGSVLGPLIFLIFIGDIDENVIHCLVKSFADDTRAAKSIKNAEDVKILQQKLQILYQNLGVLMSNDCLFKNQIDTIIEKAKLSLIHI